MKAAICYEFGHPLAIEEVDLARPGPGEVGVRIAACAICHSDITYIAGGWGGTLPAVYGHEAAGIVTETGPGVTEVAVGDHVVVTLIRSCGRCRQCQLGRQVLCEGRFALDEPGPLTRRGDGRPLHQGMRTGAFAEAVTVHASQVVAIPRDVPLASASLLACGVITGLGGVVNTADLPTGADVVVIGTGGVGLNAVQGAVLRGARTIVAVDLAEAKLEAARRFGATHAVNPSQEDPVAAVTRITEGRGADYAFVAVGAKAAIEGAFPLLARGGAVVILGMPASDVRTAFDPTTFASQGQRVLGAKMGSTRVARDIPVLVDLYRRGRLELDALVSRRYRFGEINEALDASRRGQGLRNVVIFDERLA